MKKYLLYLLVGSLLLSACQSQNNDKPAQPTPETEKVSAPQTTEVGKTEVEQQAPPTPPLFENFQAAPQLSLFPRAGAYRPEDDDEKGLQFWRTFIEHLTRTSGPLKAGAEEDPNIAFGFRAIKGLDSVGVFSPLAVTPDTTYRIEARIDCDLIEDASAGIGILEFREFLWIGDQFSESLAKEHQVATQQGIKLSGKVENQVQSFDFTTGPQTKMVHLLFFRDGAQDRNPVVIDDIGIAKAEK